MSWEEVSTTLPGGPPESDTHDARLRFHGGEIATAKSHRFRLDELLLSPLLRPSDIAATKRDNWIDPTKTTCVSDTG